MRTRIAIVGLLAGMAAAVLACTASALTLGTTTFPAGAIADGCLPGYAFEQSTTEAAYQYTVPTSGGQITAWSTNTTNATVETPLTLLLLEGAGTEFKIIHFDRETLPNPLPAGGVATFHLPEPWVVSGGQRLGLYGPSTVACYFAGGAISAADVLAYDVSASPPAIEANYVMNGSPASSLLMNVAAELTQSLDDSVTGAAAPATITAGGASEYAFTVSNSGISSAPVTFTDGVPGGLTILSAVAGSGTCTTSGQTVSCTIPNLPAGQSVPVSIVVAAPSAGSFSDTATVSAVSTPLTDTNPANNTASTTLHVNAPGPALAAPAPALAQCKLVRLTGMPLTVAKLVLPALSCKLGKVTSKPSKSVRKGYVISTSPSVGATLAAGSTVSVITSSGPPKKRNKKGAAKR